MGRLSDRDISELSLNPYVERAYESRIIYTDNFKKKFIEEYVAGKGPKEIFEDAGFDVEMIGYKRIERAAARWKRKYIEDGSLCRSK